MPEIKHRRGLPAFRRADYLSGEKLIGDGDDVKGIEQWFKDEENGYSMLRADDKKAYRYVYNALNIRYGFSTIRQRRISHAMGLGSAYGLEFMPVIDQIDRVTIVEPSKRLRASDVGGRPIHYVSPDPLGVLDFSDGKFDLITCFGVLHHIPNVSFVVSELARVLAPDGMLLLREPITNMGDWRKPRAGLTARERGIPKVIMETALSKAGLELVSSRFFDFAPFVRFVNLLGRTPVFNSPTLTVIDGILSALFSWNAKYHRPRLLDKFAPASVFWVCRKSDTSRGAG